MLTGAPGSSPAAVRSLRVVAVGDGMVPTELGEALVERVDDDVMVVVARLQGAIAEGLHLQGARHAAELELAEEQLDVGEQGVLTGLVEAV